MSSDNEPTFKVYSVIPREGKDDYWLNMGLAFPHKDGKGFNIMLQALPLDGKIVLREAAEERNEQRRPGNERDDRQDRRGDRDTKPHASFGRSGGR